MVLDLLHVVLDLLRVVLDLPTVVLDLPDVEVDQTVDQEPHRVDQEPLSRLVLVCTCFLLLFAHLLSHLPFLRIALWCLALVVRGPGIILKIGSCSAEGLF